jgi:hypothetical protein
MLVMFRAIGGRPPRGLEIGIPANMTVGGNVWDRRVFKSAGWSKIARKSKTGAPPKAAGLRFRPPIFTTSTGEGSMSKFAIRLLTLAMFSIALAIAPVITTVYAAPDSDAPPPSSTKSKKKKSSEATPTIPDAAFAKGYRAAYATIYDRNDYASAIEQLKALGHDDTAAVANLIGYSYRKLGDYKVSQVWYERALKADPNHVKTWQYYGLWQVEQGNRDQAQYHLSRIAALAGTGSEEYRSLAAALEKPPGTGLVY